MLTLAIFERASAQQVKKMRFRSGSLVSPKGVKELADRERGRRVSMDFEASTVLEQDHFYSVYLVSHVTVLTNSRKHED